MQRRALGSTSARASAGVATAAERPSWRGALRPLEWVLWGLGLAAAVYLGYVAMDALLYNARETVEMREISRTSSESSLALAALRPALSSAPVTPRRRPEPGELIGRLEIPGVGISAFVAAGTEALTLRRGVGHIDGTALPGEPGNVGLAGHRDTVFRALRKLRTSDRILLRTADGSFEYSVESLQMVTPAQVEVLDPSPHPTLTLVTCYPFDFIGPAPLRFIVRARQVAHTAPAP